MPHPCVRFIGPKFSHCTPNFALLHGITRDGEAFRLQEGVLGLINTLSGGGIARVGVFSLGIVPYINAQIIVQLATTVFPKLGDLQKKEGEAGRKKIQNYTRYAALGLALAQVRFRDGLPLPET